MAVQIQLRNDTASNWTTANPTLAQGELGIETDTRKYKIGDGSTAWNSLAYGSLIGPINLNAVVTSVSDKSANYTITADDKNTLIRSTGSAITVTINDVLAVGESISFAQWGSGQVTFAAGSGVTLASKGSKLKTSAQYAGATVTCIAAGNYWLVGDLG